ncbi:MAG: polyketide synthase, partial [bacterium]|nr:polyketide synthase [bacterium]
MNERESGNEYHGSEVAVIGMACRLPKARNIEEFWRNLCDGVEAVTFFDDEELEAAGVDREQLNDPHYVKAAPILDDVELFDASFFDYTPREAEAMDPQQRLFLECAWEALEHSGYGAGLDEGSIGVFAGGKMSTYIFNIYSNPERVRSLDTIEIGLGNDVALLSMRTSYKLDLDGPSYFVQSACSTS